MKHCNTKPKHATEGHYTSQNQSTKKKGKETDPISFSSKNHNTNKGKDETFKVGDFSSPKNILISQKQEQIFFRRKKEKNIESHSPWWFSLEARYQSLFWQEEQFSR